MPNNLT